MKILVVDDSGTDRRYLRLIVERHGHDALEAEDGLEGLRLAKIRHPDLIISDALMPLMDGFQFLKAVKDDEGLSSTPFVFYSAIYKADRDQELALSLGAAAYITKPKEPAELWRQIEAILKRPRPEHVAVPGLVAADEAYLRRYNHVVAAKLEEKVRELEETIALRLKAPIWSGASTNAPSSFRPPTRSWKLSPTRSRTICGRRCGRSRASPRWCSRITANASTTRDAACSAWCGRTRRG